MRQFIQYKYAGVLQDKQDRHLYEWHLDQRLYARILTEIRVDQWGQILATMMGAGFREEIIYRFILFKVLFLETLRLPFWIALILSSVLFGITHYNNLMRLGDPMSVIITSYQVCGATIMGCLLGYLYYYTNNLMFVILLHGMYDFINSINNTVLYKHIMEEEEKKK